MHIGIFLLISSLSLFSNFFVHYNCFSIENMKMITHIHDIQSMLQMAYSAIWISLLKNVSL